MSAPSLIIIGLHNTAHAVLFLVLVSLNAAFVILQASGESLQFDAAWQEYCQMSIGVWAR